jgi:hypothetical protein
MSRRKDMEQPLDELHKELSTLLLARLRTGEATAAELNVMRQFLKDNGIQAANTPDDPIRKLTEELPWDVDDRVYTGSPFAPGTH